MADCTERQPPAADDGLAGEGQKDMTKEAGHGRLHRAATPRS